MSGKIACPFCNGRNTFYIAYGYLGKKKKKHNYIDQKEIGLNVRYRKGYEKIDFDGEKLLSRLPNRYCKDCKKTFHSRKVMYTVDMTTIDFVVQTKENYYRYTFYVEENKSSKYTLKINWIPVKIDEPLSEENRKKILTCFKKYKPNMWEGHYGKESEFERYCWMLKCTYYNGFDYFKSGNDEIPDNWNDFVKPFKEIFKNNIFDACS